MNIQNFMKNDSSSNNIARGLISGFLGGLAGTLVKASVEQFLDVRQIDEEEEQLQIIGDLSEQVIGNRIGEEGIIAEQFKDIPLGASLGAAYGYGKRDDEEISLLDGIVLGATLWASTHDTSLPLAGQERNPDLDIPVSTQLQELLAHLLYGVSTEVVRGLVNQRIKDLKQSSNQSSTRSSNKGSNQSSNKGSNQSSNKGSKQTLKEGSNKNSGEETDEHNL